MGIKSALIYGYLIGNSIFIWIPQEGMRNTLNLYDSIVVNNSNDECHLIFRNNNHFNGLYKLSEEFFESY